jgi:hypothetical protein
MHCCRCTDTERPLSAFYLASIQTLDIPKITDFLGNFRFIVTSRQFDDIKNEFDGVQRIRQMSINDIPPAFTERDVCTYISKELEGLEF